jgi:hypothetical protein
MQGDHDNEETLGGCRMCLAIPGKIIEICSENPDTALIRDEQDQ